MKPFLIALAVLSGFILSASAANIVIMTVEDPNNYEAPRTLRDFAEKELKPRGHRVMIVLGDQPQSHHFDGLIEALKDADLLILFSRRRYPPQEQMHALRAYLDAGKPLLGIRTANHAFIPKPNEVVAPGWTPWPTFTHEVLGGENTGYEIKGLPYLVSAAPGAERHAVLDGVKLANILGRQSLYQVLPLAADATPILVGTAGAGAATPPQPVAWTRTYGAKKSRVFYTSLGAPEDMQIADVRRLLLNAVNFLLNP